MSNHRDPCLILALDFPAADPALALVDQLDPNLCRLKVGSELFTRAGPSLVRALRSRGFDVFLDLKFHDIPNTVAAACQAAADLGVWMLNVHAQGGQAMLEAAREALANSTQRPLLMAVTVLTSMNQAALRELDISQSATDYALQLARLSQQAGLDGVVCSAQEATALRAACGDNFCLVTPGIRPAGSATNDQKRILTPHQARQAGADYLVIGRPITRAADPLAALQAISEEL